jgi:hypothetical protein
MTAPDRYQWRRDKDGLGVWEHRGKVAVARVGHSPVDRRWDGVSEGTTNFRRSRESGDPEPAPGMNRGQAALTPTHPKDHAIVDYDARSTPVSKHGAIS